MQGALGGSGVSWRVLEGFGTFQVEISGRFWTIFRGCASSECSGSFFGILNTSGGFWAVVEGRRGFAGAFPPPMNEGKTAAEAAKQDVARKGVDFGRKRAIAVVGAPARY